MNKAIEEKVAWTPDPAISQANELMEHGKLDEAAAILNNYLATEPESVAGWNLLRAVHWRKNEIQAYREADESSSAGCICKRGNAKRLGRITRSSSN